MDLSDIDPALIREMLGFDPELISKFDVHRGNIIGLWAGIESSMDQANYYAWLYSKKTVSDAVPVGLQRKIKLFKQVNRDLLPFEPLRATAAELAERVDDLYNDRHWMAHGMIIPDQCTDSSWTLYRHEFPRGTGGLEMLKRTFAEEEVRAFKFKAIQLGVDFSGYLRTLAEQVLKHPPEN